jgi:Sec-independent protein secretion pathway component TatC
MKPGLSLSAFGHATSLFLAITFTVCVGFDLAFPQMAMYQSWQALLPGFTWISWPSFLLGLVESYGYGWYAALIWVPLYNLFVARAARRSRD